MNKTLGAVFGAALAILGTISASMAAPAFVTGLGNVYDAPGRASSVVAILPEGATVDANCTNDGWCQITGIGGSTGTNGWMMSNNVRFGDLNPPRPQPPQPQPPQPRQRAQNARRVVLRQRGRQVQLRAPTRHETRT